MSKEIDWSKGRPPLGDVDIDAWHKLCDVLEAWAEDLSWRDVYHGNAGDVLQVMDELGWHEDWLKRQAAGFFVPKARAA